MLTNPNYSRIFRIFPEIHIKTGILSLDGVGNEGTYFVLPLEVWNICSFQIFGIPPILRVVSKITNNSCELLTVSSLSILGQIINAMNFIVKPKKN